MKRRFIRQNREISRVNSSQSLRIQNLEAEISRLLTENITIREESIRRAQEVQQLRRCQRTFKEVEKVKEQLQTKLGEAATLITEVGALTEKAKRKSSLQQLHGRRKSGLLAEVKPSPDQGRKKSKLSISGAVIGERQAQEGRLPAIAEGKPYHKSCRTSLEGLDLSRLADADFHAEESPELGSPPVAHFDVAEPIDSVSHESPTSGLDLREVEHAQDHASSDNIKPLPVCMERRRKRRASSLIEYMATDDVLEPAITAISQQSEPQVPVSAKRKQDGGCFATTERTDTKHNSLSSAKSKQPSLQKSTVHQKAGRFAKSKDGNSSTSMVTKEHASMLKPAPRKILAPKSTNSPSKVIGRADTTSPATETKEGASMQTKKTDMLHTKTTLLARAHTSLSEAASPKLQEIGPYLDLAPAELGESTPIDDTFFSPASTETSGKPEKATEVALTASVEDVLGGKDGRATRRARGAVSYAEPSLRAKMRRPSERLIPAVLETSTTDTKTQQTPQTPKDRTKSSNPQAISTTVDLLTAQTGVSNMNRDPKMGWETFSGSREELKSPLGGKASSSNTSSPSSLAAAAGNTVEAQTHAGETNLTKAMDKMSLSEELIPSVNKSEPGQTSGNMVDMATRRRSSHATRLRRVSRSFNESPLMGQLEKTEELPSGTAKSSSEQTVSSTSANHKGCGIDVKRAASVSRLNRPTPSATKRKSTGQGDRSSDAGADDIGISPGLSHEEQKTPILARSGRIAAKAK